MKQNLLNKVFGRLLVIKHEGINKHYNQLWKCKCICGTKKIITASDLMSDHTKSCGCLRKETIANFARKHGKTTTPIYLAWRNMKNRCYGKNRTDYKHYGGRGIFVCDRWKDSFINFYHDMGDKPFEKATIERVDNNGPYSPKNCVWATIETQRNNYRRNRMITIHGETKNLLQWCKIFDRDRNTFYYRVNECNWPEEKALITPTRGQLKLNRPRL